ncbi:MAG: serine/threonine protein kinase, partial [Candidatus Eisenbacteria bacterium]|nr:serine/threonine protein kinase [Candidatus Eisenbacteria bacterium]
MNKDVDTRDADAYERLLSALADDAPVEWDADREAFAAGEPLRFAPLQELSRIAEFHRALQRAPHGSAMPEPAEWGPLLLLERLALGARSEVWRAWDPALRREVALKLIDAGTLSGPAAEGALLDEARAAARVSHPHVVVVHGVARHGDRVGLWMELVRGQSLDAIVRQGGALPAEGVARLGADLAAALAAAHAAGVLHRDLKPANVIRDTSGRWVLVDFGLGLTADRRDSPAHASAGTPMYLAPEIFRGGKPGESSDVYSLGLLLWFALTGADAFPASNVAERVRMAEAGVDESARRAARRADGALARLIERAIERECASRWPSAAAFEQALRAWKPGGGVTPRAALLPLAGAIVVVLALAWFGPWRDRNRATDAPSPAAVASPAPSTTYAVEASLVRRGAAG